MAEQISAATKEYLRVIFELGHGSGVRSVDVANSLGVSKPSVNKAVKVLAEQGFLQQERYAMINMTAKGIQLAQSFEKKTEIVQALLEDVFEVNSEAAKKDAKKIADAIGSETFEKMRMYLNNFHYNN